jgi:hypothetical protein
VGAEEVASCGRRKKEEYQEVVRSVADGEEESI